MKLASALVAFGKNSEKRMKRRRRSETIEFNENENANENTKVLFH